MLMSFWNTLQTADKINFAIAAGTFIAALAALVSLLIAGRSVRDAVRQLRAETFMSILTYEREINFSEHMSVIRALEGKPANKLDDDERKRILVVVNFLNHVAHLIRDRYVEPKQLFLLYAPSVAACRRNLIGEGKWLDEERKRTKESRYYLHFETLCDEETEDLIWHNHANRIVWTGDVYKPALG